uniref:F-box domain-containing protein n=1 Tax=Opuntia streptacantha TaxID=393608 RepID=A0A7C8Z9W7_OPUST
MEYNNSECSSGLPMELVTEVLIRLPVKRLVRCRCVCKAWCSLISSPDFVSIHFSRLHNSEDQPLPLTLYSSGRETFCTLRPALTYKKVIDKDHEIPIAKHLEDLKNCYMYKICHADGLVLMTKTFTSETLLLNPLLGKTIELSPIWSNIDRAVFGIGFDIARNHYKVVVIGKYPIVRV